MPAKWVIWKYLPQKVSNRNESMNIKVPRGISNMRQALDQCWLCVIMCCFIIIIINDISQTDLDLNHEHHFLSFFPSFLSSPSHHPSLSYIVSVCTPEWPKYVILLQSLKLHSSIEITGIHHHMWLLFLKQIIKSL